MEPNQNYTPMNIKFCIEHNDERFLQNMTPPPSTKVLLTYNMSDDKN